MAEMYRANGHSIRHNWIIVHPVHFRMSNRIKIHGIQWKYMSSNHSSPPVYLAVISMLCDFHFGWFPVVVVIVEYIEQQWRTQILANFGDQHQNWVSRCYFGFYWELLTHSSLLRCHLPFLVTCHCFPFDLLLFVVYHAVKTADAAECCTLQRILCIAVQAPALYKPPPHV